MYICIYKICIYVYRYSLLAIPYSLWIPGTEGEGDGDGEGDIEGEGGGGGEGQSQSPNMRNKVGPKNEVVSENKVGPQNQVGPRYASVSIRVHSLASVTRPYDPICLHTLPVRIQMSISNAHSSRKVNNTQNVKLANL